MQDVGDEGRLVKATFQQRLEGGREGWWGFLGQKKDQQGPGPCLIYLRKREKASSAGWSLSREGVEDGGRSHSCRALEAIPRIWLLL